MQAGRKTKAILNPHPVFHSILNTAQVCAIAPTLSLITFDGDMTLLVERYPDVRK
jgi:hypothetical protein